MPEEESQDRTIPLEQLRTDRAIRVILHTLTQDNEQITLLLPDCSIPVTHLIEDEGTINLGALHKYPILKPVSSWLTQYPQAKIVVSRERFKQEAEKLKQQQAALFETERTWWESYYLDEERFESESTQISKLFTDIRRATQSTTNSPDITIPRDDVRNRVFIALDPVFDQSTILSFLLRNGDFTEFNGYNFRKNQPVGTRNFVLPLIHGTSQMPVATAKIYKDIQREILDYLDFLIANPDIPLRSHRSLGIDTTPAEIISEIRESRNAIEKKFNLRKFEFFVVSCLAPGIAIDGKQQPALRIHLTQSKEISESKSGSKNLRLFADEGIILP